MATRLAETASVRFDTFSVSCPVQLKGVLGTARPVVGSRFHALVGALSQGVPVLAIGWSHKYDELLRQFDCPECLLTVHVAAKLKDQLTTLVESPTREDLVARIQAAGQRLRSQIDAMWGEVDRVLGMTAGTTRAENN